MPLLSQQKLVLILSTPDGWKAESAYGSWLITYLDGLPVQRWFTRPSTNQTQR